VHSELLRLFVHSVLGGPDSAPARSAPGHSSWLCASEPTLLDLIRVTANKAVQVGSAQHAV